MVPAGLSERLDALLDDLIMDGGVEAASMASILLAAKDSLKSGSLVALSRIVWAANCDLKAGSLSDQAWAERSEGPQETQAGDDASAAQPYCHAG